MADEIVILDGARTAWAEYSGTPGFGKLKDKKATELGAIAAKKAIEKSGIRKELIDHVIMGHAMQTGQDACYGARHVVLLTGLPQEVPGLTINRLCGSGIESIASAARFLKLGEAKAVVAGGMESMSQAPYVLRNVRGPVRVGFGQELKLVDSLFEGLRDGFCDMFMAQTSDKVAKQYEISREAQDEFALRSHQEACRAAKDGLFKQEIVPVEVKTRKETIVVDADDHLKPDTSLEKLAKLRTAFGKEGTVTAGNASGVVDGAAALVVTTSGLADKEGLKPIGRIVEYAAVGVDPTIMGIGPAPAIRKVLERSGVKQDEIDLFEINEAFSGQYLAVEKELGVDRSKVNVNGGSIGLGHPLGATGTRLVLTVLYELKRRNKRRGIAAACIGGGQGIAMLVETL